METHDLVLEIFQRRLGHAYTSQNIESYLQCADSLLNSTITILNRKDSFHSQVIDYKDDIQLSSKILEKFNLKYKGSVHPINIDTNRREIRKFLNSALDPTIEVSVKIGNSPGISLKSEIFRQGIIEVLNERAIGDFSSMNFAKRKSKEMESCLIDEFLQFNTNTINEELIRLKTFVYREDRQKALTLILKDVVKRYIPFVYMYFLKQSAWISIPSGKAADKRVERFINDYFQKTPERQQ